jgi:hypothetical protein
VVTASEDKTARVWDLALDNGTVADWARIAERSPYILRGIAVVPGPPPSYLTPADAAAPPDATAATRVQLP